MHQLFKRYLESGFLVRISLESCEFEAKSDMEGLGWVYNLSS